MSRDTYPRVVAHISFEGDEWPWQTAVDGTHKVVPADALVIERGEVGEVHRGVVTGGITAEKAHEMGVRYLAIAEYLRTHPPVDEAEVERLERLITQQPGWSVGSDRLARDLYLAGVRAPEVTE